MSLYLPSIEQIQADVKTIVEDNGTGTKLIGIALFGTNTSEACWKILKVITVQSAGSTTTTVLCAEKNGKPAPSYEHVWDDRASLQYS